MCIVLIKTQISYNFFVYPYQSQFNKWFCISTIFKLPKYGTVRFFTTYKTYNIAFYFIGYIGLWFWPVWVYLAWETERYSLSILLSFIRQTIWGCHIKCQKVWKQNQLSWIFNFIQEISWWGKWLDLKFLRLVPSEYNDFSSISNIFNFFILINFNSLFLSIACCHK